VPWLALLLLLVLLVQLSLPLLAYRQQHQHVQQWHHVVTRLNQCCCGLAVVRLSSAEHE
jgi:hypothetical protein